MRGHQHSEPAPGRRPDRAGGCALHPGPEPMTAGEAKHPASGIPSADSAHVRLGPTGQASMRRSAVTVRSAARGRAQARGVSDVDFSRRRAWAVGSDGLKGEGLMTAWQDPLGPAGGLIWVHLSVGVVTARVRRRFRNIPAITGCPTGAPKPASPGPAGHAASETATCQDATT
jgi:hypothetical protein